MTTATIDGHTITECSIAIPAWGIWWGDVEIDEPEQLSGAVDIEIGELVLSGTIVSGGPWQGRARYRVAGGSGGWGQSIAARSYANDAGVKLLTVLSDAAADCGETLDVTTVSGTIGPQWVREAGPASRALALLAARNWYVAETGVTKIGARESETYQGLAAIVKNDVARRRVVLAADDLTGLVPGAIVESIEAVDVVHTLDDEKLRTTIYGERGASSRVTTALARLIETLAPETLYRGVWSYRIVAQSGERLDLQIERTSSGMPDLQRVRVRPGIAGARADHTVGSMVLVTFIDGDPGRPVVVAGDDAESPGFVPSELDLCEGDGRVLREGDTLSITNVTPGPGTTGAIATVTLGLGAPPTPSKVFT